MQNEFENSFETFKLLTENSFDIMNILSADGTIIFESKATKRILGYEAGERVGKNTFEFVHPDDIQQIVTEFQYLVLHPNSIKVVEFRFKHIDGSWKWLQTSGQNFLSNPYINGIIINSRDITERKEADMIISKQNKELKKLNADKDRFIQILAHDLKNPFNALIGFSDLLLRNIRKFDIERIEKNVLIINKTTHSTFNLFEDLLLWSKSQSGKIHFEPISFNISDILTDIVEIQKTNAEPKNISIHYSDTKNDTIFADINMVKTILRNLISNAIKFTQRNGQIKIFTEKEANKLTIIVSDNGIGIKKENDYWQFYPKN